MMIRFDLFWFQKAVIYNTTDKMWCCFGLESWRTWLEEQTDHGTWVNLTDGSQPIYVYIPVSAIHLGTGYDTPHPLSFSITGQRMEDPFVANPSVMGEDRVVFKFETRSATQKLPMMA